MRTLFVLAALVAAAAGAFWWLTAPEPLAAGALPATHQPDLANGERVFWAAGCASCHAADRAEGDARLVLSGGLRLATPLGPITVPNISPDPERGIGNWTTAEFANALTRGLSPEGTYYTPAFPWTSYRFMRPEDVVDLKAFLDTLPPSDNAAEPSGLPFPWSWRRPVGLWARFVMTSPPAAPAGADAAVARGHYLVTALGHCGECHTPRNLLFALDPGRWLAGAPNPEGRGTVPNITPSREGIGDWSPGDIAYLLESGFTPDFDSVGGSMASVTRNYAHVPAEDRAAIAAYLKAIAPIPPPS
jgi:mono/diheme cytochrome c family protein